MTRHVAIGPILVAAISAACTCGRRPDGACDDPSLWYEPGGEGVYWGCTPPEGWTNTPARGTADTAAPVDPSPDEPGPLVLIPEPQDVDTAWVGTGFTGTTGTTGATGMTGDTGVFDTGLPFDTALPLETGALDTAPGDTVAPDTSVPLVDTAAPPDAAPAPLPEEPPA